MLNLQFNLIESILWDNGYQLLDLHIDRLVSSANFFGFSYDLQTLMKAFDDNATILKSDVKYKVRLLLKRSGDFKIENIAILNNTQKPFVAFSQITTNSANVFLYHKTTNRQCYDAEYKKAVKHGLADVLFTNEKDEVTEGAISNIFIQQNGYLYTPPVACGLLPGVFRRHILSTVKNASEKVFKKDDVYMADKVFICNAIRGLREVKVISSFTQIQR